MIIDVSEGGCDRGRRSLAGLEMRGRISDSPDENKNGCQQGFGQKVTSVSGGRLAKSLIQ